MYRYVIRSDSRRRRIRKDPLWRLTRVFLYTLAYMAALVLCGIAGHYCNYFG